MRLTLIAVAVLQAALSSQTFIVDANNGPGTNFTSLPNAAASVPDGAVLLVRQGSYAGFSIAQKGLTVLADPGTYVSGTIEVTNTAPHQTLVLRNVRWLAPPAFAPCVRVDSCAGAVVLEALANPGWPGTFPVEPWPLEVVSCDRLVVRESMLAGRVRFDGVVGVIESCELTGTGFVGFFSPIGTTPGLAARDCDLQIVGSTIRGGDGYGTGPVASLPASDGIQMVLNSSVRLMATTVISGADGLGHRFALAGLNSSARYDAQTVLVGGVQPWSITAQLSTMPHLLASGAPAGGALQATVATENGDLVVLAIGLPGPPVTVPGFQDPFWLDPAVHVFHAIGVQSQGAPITGSVAVPNAPGFAGLWLVWHAACFGPVTGQQNTNPGIGLVH